MPTATDRAREALLAELEPLQQQADTLRQQLAQVESEQAPLVAALAVFDEQRRGQAKPQANGRKPCAKKADVEAVCYALLCDNRSLAQSDLEGLAKAKLSDERGMSLSGFGLRFKECLASSRFNVSAEGVVSLVGSSSPRVAFPAVDKTPSGSLRG